MKLFGSAEPEHSDRWSKLFYFLEQILPRPAKTAHEFCSFRYEGRLAEPWTAVTMSVNSWPSEFYQKLCSLSEHFSERSKRNSDRNSVDDSRFVDFTLRRADVAREHIGMAGEEWLSRPSWAKLAADVQRSPDNLTLSAIKLSLPLHKKEYQLAERINIIPYLLGLVSWSNIEHLATDIRRVCEIPYSPSNAIAAFIEATQKFLRLNPVLDGSTIPTNSRGAPLALTIDKLRPSEPSRTCDEFSSWWSTNAENISSTVQFRFRESTSQNPNNKRNATKNKNKRRNSTNTDADVISINEDSGEVDTPKNSLNSGESTNYSLLSNKANETSSHRSKPKKKGKGKGKGKRRINYASSSQDENKPNKQ